SHTAGHDGYGLALIQARMALDAPDVVDEPGIFQIGLRDKLGPEGIPGHEDGPGKIRRVCLGIVGFCDGHGAYSSFSPSSVSMISTASSGRYRGSWAAGMAVTSLSRDWIRRVRTPMRVSNSLLARVNCFWARVSTSWNRSNSVLTAPSTFHTSPLRFWMATVRKPICRLLSRAAMVEGPARFTWHSSW